jgi:hypothetical protein
MLERSLSVVALRGADWIPDYSSHQDGVIDLELDSPDARATLAMVVGRAEACPVRAAATDVSEVPPPAEASPGARGHAVLPQPVEMIR